MLSLTLMVEQISTIGMSETGECCLTGMLRHLLAVTVLLFASAHPVAAQTISEFSLPFRARSIVAGPDGALWFAGMDKIGRITTGGEITEFLIPVSASARPVFPFDMTSGPDGALWFNVAGAISRDAMMPYTAVGIGRITTGGEFSEFLLPPMARLPPLGLTAGPDGALWFTEQLANKIGRLTTAGEFSEFLLPTPNNFLYSITTGPDGAIWFVEGNQNESEIGRITVAQDQENDSVQSVRIPQAASDCSEPRESADKVRGRTAWPLSILVLSLLIVTYGLHSARAPIRQS